MATAKLPRFGQELYLRETVEAARLLDRLGAGAHAAQAVSAILPQSSPTTRRRVATKIVQRLHGGMAGSNARTAFVRLLAGLQDSEARRELVLYGTATSDLLVGAIARELLYPYFVEEGLPVGVTADEASLQRDGVLVTMERMLTLRVLGLYAERRWAFTSERCLRLGLRILQHAGVLFPQRIRGASGAVQGYVQAPHGMSLPTLVWCFHAELSAASPPPTEDRVLTADFARTLVAPPSLVHARLREAEREGLLSVRHGPGGRRVTAPLPLEVSIDRLIEC